MAELGQLFDIDSIKAMQDGAVENFKKSKTFIDSSATSGLVLAQNLNHIDKTVLEQKYPENVMMNAGLHVDNSGRNMNTVQSLRTDSQGSFRDADDETSAKGAFSISAESGIIRVLNREGAANWTDTDIAKAALQGFSLTQRLFGAMHKKYMSDLDVAISLGIYGLNGKQGFASGVLNHEGFASTTSIGRADELTSEELYEEFAELITSQHDGVNNTPEYMGNKIITPTRVINVLSSKILNTANGHSTVLKALRDNFPGIDFSGTFRADSDILDAPTTAFINTGRDSSVIRIPEPLTVGAIVKKGSFSHAVDSRYQIAGIDILENASGKLLLGL